MKEMTTLAQATVQKAIDDHVKDLSTDLNTLSSVSPATALSVTTTLETSLQANKDALLNTAGSDSASTEEAIRTVDGALKKVSDQEVKIISKEIDSISTDISNTSENTATTDLTTTPVTPVAP
jgi:hypothetical protein